MYCIDSELVYSLPSNEYVRTILYLWFWQGLARRLGPPGLKRGLPTLGLGKPHLSAKQLSLSKQQSLGVGGYEKH